MKKESTRKKTANKKPASLKGNKKDALFVIILLIVTFFLYLRVTEQNFVNWDDPDMITNNTQIQSLSAKNIISIFTPSKEAGEFQPLTTLSYALNYHFAEFTPGPYKFINLLLHLLNILLVFTLLLRINIHKNAVFFVTILFALHPIQVEVVAWASARNYLLFSAFFLLSCLQYIKYIKSEFKYKHLIFAFLLFVPALLSKSSAIVLIPTLFCFDFLFKRTLHLKLLYEKTPFLLGALLISFIALMPKTGSQYADMSSTYNFFDRIFFVFYSVSFYIIKTIVPFSQKVIYMYPKKPGIYLPIIYYLAPVFLASIGFLFYQIKKNKRELLFSLFFFISNLILIIHLVPTDRTGITAERYMYLAGIGLFLCVVILLQQLVDSFSFNKKYFFAMLTIYAALMLFKTHKHIDVWTDSRSLWKSEIEVNPKNGLAYINLGEAYHKNKNYKKAISNYEKALEIKPRHKLAFNNIGLAKFEMGNIPDAIKYYNKAISIDSGFALAYYNRGNAKYENDSFKNALNDFNKAININSEYAQAFCNRGLVYKELNEKENALADFNKAIDLNSEYENAYNNRGIIKVEMEEYDVAIQDFNKALEINNKFAKAYLNKGIAYFYQDNIPQACSNWRLSLANGNNQAQDLINSYCK